MITCLGPAAATSHTELLLASVPGALSTLHGLICVRVVSVCEAAGRQRHLLAVAVIQWRVPTCLL